jgi:hypothetical protein
MKFTGVAPVAVQCARRVAPATRTCAMSSAQSIRRSGNRLRHRPFPDGAYFVPGSLIVWHHLDSGDTDGTNCGDAQFRAAPNMFDAV